MKIFFVERNIPVCSYLSTVLLFCCSGVARSRGCEKCRSSRITSRRSEVSLWFPFLIRHPIETVHNSSTVTKLPINALWICCEHRLSCKNHINNIGADRYWRRCELAAGSCVFRCLRLSPFRSHV